jgi:hypothetical protein
MEINPEIQMNNSRSKSVARVWFDTFDRLVFEKTGQVEVEADDQSPDINPTSRIVKAAFGVAVYIPMADRSFERTNWISEALAILRREFPRTVVMKIASPWPAN